MSTAHALTAIERKEKLFNKHCIEEIEISIPPELMVQLSSISNLDIKALQDVKKLKAEELINLFKLLCSLTADNSEIEVTSGLTIEQHCALEQFKLLIMSAVYEDLLQKSKNQQDVEIAKKIQEIEERKQKEEAAKNVWWKKLIAHVGFWAYFAYSVSTEFLGFAGAMIEILGLTLSLSALANPFVLLVAIPMTLLAAGMYLAFEGTMFGFTVSKHEKNRLSLMGEQIDANAKINGLLADSDYTKSFSSDTYRSFANLSILFNNAIDSRKQTFKPKERVVRKRLYWVACALGLITTLGGGYYAGVTFLAAFATLGLVATPAVAAIVIGLIMASLLVSFVFMQSNGIAEIFIPTQSHEQDVKDKLDTATLKDQESYNQKIQERTLSEHASMFTEPTLNPACENQLEKKPEIMESRIIEHTYNDVECHKVNNRPRSRSLNFTPGVFSGVKEEAEKSLAGAQQVNSQLCTGKKNTGF